MDLKEVIITNHLESSLIKRKELVTVHGQSFPDMRVITQISLANKATNKQKQTIQYMQFLVGMKISYISEVYNSNGLWTSTICYHSTLFLNI